MNTDIIRKVQNYGFDVYMRKTTDSWLFFTDGQRIGYLQADQNGFTLATVNRPNVLSGVGFQVRRHESDFNKAALEECFLVAPMWASNRDRDSVRKYRDMKDFINADDWNRGYGKVEL